MNGVSTLKKDTPESSPQAPSTVVRTQKSATWHPGLGLPASRTVKKYISVAYELPVLCFV